MKKDYPDLTDVIPSKAIHKFICGSRYEFKDKHLASLIYHSPFIKFFDRMRKLQQLMDVIEDQTLKQELAEYIADTQIAFYDFKRNDNRDYVYVISPPSDQVDLTRDNPSYGFFADYDTAYQKARTFDTSFMIVKQIIVTKEDDENHVLFMLFDKSGGLVDFNDSASYRNLKNRKDHFTFSFYETPNPFDRGDIVKILTTGEYGVVAHTQKEWQDHLVDVATRDSRYPPHESDSWIRVDIIHPDFTATHQNVTPVFLDKYEPQDWGKGSALDDLLRFMSRFYRGEGSIEHMFQIMLRYKNETEENSEEM